MKSFYLYIILIGLVSCNSVNQEGLLYSGTLSFSESTPMVNDYGKTILERFDVPLNYNRISTPPNTFADYLRTLSLKPEDAVTYNEGKVKPQEDVYVSIVDLPNPPKNLQTSTDAVIRLMSEYYYKSQAYDHIVFHDNKEKYNYVEYVSGNYSRSKFDEYLDFVMEKVSTPSFCADLKPIKLNDIKIGDIFVQNTQPTGHVVIVVDLAVNSDGEKIFLLAQGFQPAKDIQILSNPNSAEYSPWYQLKEGELLTPEWRFMTSDLMRFKFL